MNHLLTLLLDRLGLERTSDVDERMADLAVSLACLRSDHEDLKALVQEFAHMPPREANA